MSRRSGGAKSDLIDVSQVAYKEEDERDVLVPDVKKMHAMSSGSIVTSGTIVLPLTERRAVSNDIIPSKESEAKTDAA